jgi:hypothetical protein
MTLNSPALGQGRWEKPLIAALCALAAIRVFVFSATFPFFNNVDEQFHVDLVLKYARGEWPSRRVEQIDPSVGRLVFLYGTFEYFHSPDEFPGGVAPRPSWEQEEVPKGLLERVAAHWGQKTNSEAHSPPVYYAVAGAWYALGGWLGLSDGQQLYWVRFLNAPLIGLLVACAYRFCRDAYPGRPELRIGVPLLLAFLPQDAFYSINADVLSPLLFLVSLQLLRVWDRRELPGALRSVATGFLVAMTFLVKFTNLALPILFGASVLRKLHRQFREGRARSALFATAIAPLAAGLPVALWFWRNARLLGDPTGMQLKIAALEWTRRPLAAWLSHPIFTWQGLWTFWDHLMRTLWRGEFVWHLEPIACAPLDAFYSISSTLLLVAAGIAWATGRSRVPDRTVHTAVWASVILSVLCLVVLSVSFEYGHSTSYPSPQFPYFTSGRLIAGALVPFLILYVDGLASLLSPLSRVAAPLLFVLLLSVAMTVSEVALTTPVFANAYNWFHLP